MSGPGRQFDTPDTVGKEFHILARHPAMGIENDSIRTVHEAEVVDEVQPFGHGGFTLLPAPRCGPCPLSPWMGVDRDEPNSGSEQDQLDGEASRTWIRPVDLNTI